MRVPSAAVAIAVAMFPAIAAAQPKPSYDPAIDVQLLEWGIGPKAFFSVADGGVGDKQRLSFDAVLTFMTDPFVVYTASGQRTDVVHSLTAMQLAASYGLSDRFQVGVALPVIFDLQGDAFDQMANGPGSGGLEVTGLGDLRVEVKARLWAGHRLRFSGIGGGTVPTSNGTENAQFTGDNTPTARGKVVLDWSDGPLTFAANAGAIIRKTRDVYGGFSVTVGDQAVWGAAAAYRLAEHVALIGEGFGATNLTGYDSSQMPIELDVGVRVYATSSMSVVVGGGAGVHHGVGSPDTQFFFGIGYAPDMRDSDGDGIPNTRDKCPFAPEDKDGFQDQDGCPDDDNDGDHRPDAVDKCPNEPEDIDGFEDDDGCPDLDNDKDGIPDAQDKCPNQPEDGLPPFPHDGCPQGAHGSDDDDADRDSDGDGIPDNIDKCPLCPEDKDGFEDADGCPDLDNDNDGIPDAQDRCPNEPETVNGFEDADGCPDTGGLNVARVDGDRLVIDTVPALAGRVLTHAGEGVVAQMALVMAGHHEITAWVIAVAQPSGAKAKLLAAAIKTELIKRGVTADITMLDKAGGNQIGGAVKTRIDPAAVRVCPAGMEVVPPVDTPTAPPAGQDQ